jgi:hypothetical protein
MSIIAAVVAAVASVPSRVQAHDNAGTNGAASDPTMGRGMMNMPEKTGEMMDHCSRMMQGDSGKPNDQWRDGIPPTGGQTEKKQ